MTLDPTVVGMRQVPLAQKALADYTPIVGAAAIADITELARPLQGARIAHVSATARRGGAAQTLQALVPLMRSVGLHAEWRVLSGSNAFFRATNTMHAALHGSDRRLTPAMRAIYELTNHYNAATFEDSFDFVVVHDPQPAALYSLGSGFRGTWIWHCHSDLKNAANAHWQFLRPFLDAYAAAVFTTPAAVRQDVAIGKLTAIPPAVDPLCPKNAPMADAQVSTLVAFAGVDPTRPILLQVSPFGPSQDHLGAIDIFRTVRTQIPDLQLVILGAVDHGDPECAAVHQSTMAYAYGDPDIHVLANLGGSEEVNAFQRHAAMILHKPRRAGFSLTVAEGLWKERPVIANGLGDIPPLIQDGVTGYRAESIQQCTERVLTVLREPEHAAALGRRGREVVQQSFLCTAYLRRYLQLLTDLAGYGGRAEPPLPTDLYLPDCNFERRSGQPHGQR